MSLLMLICFTLVSFSEASGDIDGSDPFGGASWQFELSSCKISWPDASSFSDVQVKQKRLLGETANGTVPSDRTIADYINTFKPAFEKINSRLKTLFVQTRKGHTEGRLKSVQSVKDNIIKYNKSLSSFYDIIGFRVTLRTVSDVLKAKQIIENDVVNFTVKKVKCYGVCSGGGKYREDGYRRVHFIVEVAEKMAEIQLSTPYMTLFADYTHDLVYKGPAAIANDPNVKNYTLELAEYYYNLDDARDKLPECPGILVVADVSEILEKSLGKENGQKVYKKLGEPPNACQWWNDLLVNHVVDDSCPASDPKTSNSVSSYYGNCMVWILTLVWAIMTL